ncbi:D-alanyl-D-alanine carboxypeptidase [Leminorella richardii]|uniref:D-alanyl-D-alanine carboxypeptidase n=1 Tax=Leminorella richardii TaxID=158841 RepID=A0A2X4XBC5_9GAMM|nr:M15 family metallopeptidase [Leminorella richardii]SQI37075.1 D-alanyl-D-alanine carboxypeptidase [Leminorella richardii]
MIALSELTGQSDGHLAALSGSHRLQPEAVTAFSAMQAAAALAGFSLQPASTFRDFARQQKIWNDKFNGLRPVLDADSQPIDISALSDEQRCRAILRWSALPGASRHHWGTDLDVYDPDLLPEGQKLQLEPWEYERGGYFYALTRWLSANMAQYGFYRPFVKNDGGVAVEPWHLSYHPLAEPLSTRLTPEVLLLSWEGQEIAGYEWLSAHLDEVFQRYISPPQGAPSCTG